MTDIDMPMYWWIETGRHLFPKQHERQMAEGDRFDVVKVAGRLKILALQEIIEEAMEHNAPKWVVDLFRTLKAKTLQDFCGGPAGHAQTSTGRHEEFGEAPPASPT